jgi:hypothetical protein
MSKAFSLRASLLAAAVLPAFAAPAFAAQISYVSSKGADAGACSTAAAPCRTFAYAHGQTSAGGEIKALDAGEYGPLTITKSITVTGVEGASAGQPNVGDDVVITAGAADTVTLVGLTIQGLHPNASVGVRVNRAATFTMKNCIVRNLNGTGIAILPTSVKTKYLIVDTTISKVAGHGVYIGRNDNVADGVVHRVEVNNAGLAGVYSQDFSYANVTETTVVNSAYGFRAGNNGWIDLSHNTAMGNTVGLSIDANAYAVYSAGNNFIHQNNTNIAGGAPTTVTLK